MEEFIFIIDGHAHACGGFLNIESIVKILNETGTDKVVLVPGELNSSREYSLPNLAKIFPNKNVLISTNVFAKLATKGKKVKGDFIKGNAFVYSLVQQLPDRIIQFYLITDKTCSSELEQKYQEWAFKGLKLHQCWFPVKIDSMQFLDIADWAENKDLPIFIHLLSNNEGKKLIAYKKKHPKLKVIVGHLFSLEKFIKDNTKFENLYFDICAWEVVSDKRVLKAKDFFGAEKLVLGSDTPYSVLGENIERVKRLPISQKEKELILGLNLERILKI